HAGGDAALQHLANCMTEHFRDTDILCRFGGEEFFVIMPDANLEIATRRAEELRSSVRGLDVRLKGQALSKFTISAGAAVFPDHARDASSLIAAVDAALYEAKRLGRDRVVPADHPRQELIAV
ncbi:MAG: GGDEF domain-containing protein, partial [Thermoanaerobaculia bacterium]